MTISDPESPRWRSGPYVYGAVLFSLPLLALVLWALPTTLPVLLRGNFSHVKAGLAALWAAALIACPVAALVFRRRYLLSEEWRRPRRLSILLASLTYALAIATYVGVGLLLLNRPV